MAEPGRRKVLFICLGNICRSPIAEAIFKEMITKEGVANQWFVDSAAIGDWMIGKSPDKRAQKVLRQHKITYNHIARQVKKKDFEDFDYIFGMDDENISDLEAIKETTRGQAKIQLLGEWDSEKKRIIPDPYFGSNQADFDGVFDQCYRCCKAFLKSFDTSG